MYHVDADLPTGLTDNCGAPYFFFNITLVLLDDRDVSFKQSAELL